MCICLVIPHYPRGYGVNQVTHLKVSAHVYQPTIESEGCNSYQGDVHEGVVAGGIDEVGLISLRCDTIYCTSKQLPWTV